jgi:type VI protein secretion system component VasK
MTDAPAPNDLEAWLDRLAAHLPPDIVAEAGTEERTALLDLARIAAHGSERIAAPITTYLAGVAFAGLPRPERLARLQALVAALTP